MGWRELLFLGCRGANYGYLLLTLDIPTGHGTGLRNDLPCFDMAVYSDGTLICKNPFWQKRCHLPIQAGFLRFLPCSSIFVMACPFFFARQLWGWAMLSAPYSREGPYRGVVQELRPYLPLIELAYEWGILWSFIVHGIYLLDVYVDECIHLLNKALMWMYIKEILSINLSIMQFLISYIMDFYH